MSYEFATLEVQNVILHPNLGLFSSDDAVSKTYVDAKVDTAISSLINSAPATLDTLKEIATALNNDANLATTLANSISSEATSRAVADTLLSSQITALSTSSAAALASETAARTAADATLTSALNAEVSLRSTQKTAIDASLAAEISARAAADVALGLRVDDEKTRAEAIESYHGEQLESLIQNKLEKAGDTITGDMLVASTGSLVMEDSFLYFGANWRVKASSDGSRIVFEYKKDNVWKGAVPFIAPQ